MKTVMYIYAVLCMFLSVPVMAFGLPIAVLNKGLKLIAKRLVDEAGKYIKEEDK